MSIESDYNPSDDPKYGDCFTLENGGLYWSELSPKEQSWLTAHGKSRIFTIEGDVLRVAAFPDVKSPPKNQTVGDWAKENPPAGPSHDEVEMFWEDMPEVSRPQGQVAQVTFDSIRQEIGGLTKDKSLVDLEDIWRRAAPLYLSEGQREELFKAAKQSGFCTTKQARDTFAEQTAKYMQAQRSADGNYKGRLQLTSTTREPIGNAYNAAIVLGGLYGRDKTLYYDEFHQGIFFRNAKIKDTDYNELLMTVQADAIPHARMEHIRPAVDRVARENSIHSLRDYLSGLRGTWDEVDRSNWMQRWCGVADTEYLRLVSRWTLLGAVARALNPGEKVDHITALIGEQGDDKSKVWKVLSGKRSIEFTADFTGKDGLMQMQGRWFVEFAELTSLKGREASDAKAFITKEVDNWRNPYGIVNQEYERSFVLCATGNREEFLSDITGNRRYWIAEVHNIQIDQLLANVDQIWAETLARYDAGEKWFPVKGGNLTDGSIRAALDSGSVGSIVGVNQEWFYSEQDKVNSRWMQFDIWLSPIMRYCQNLTRKVINRDTGAVEEQSFTPSAIDRTFRAVVTGEEVATAALGMGVDYVDKIKQRRIGAVLRTLGYEPKTIRIGGGTPEWGWKHVKAAKLGENE